MGWILSQLYASMEGFAQVISLWALLRGRETCGRTQSPEVQVGLCQVGAPLNPSCRPGDGVKWAAEKDKDNTTLEPLWT